ncbi:unnamed protein product [Soboliphyme baturini]|uniref:Transcriptional adapter 2-alpha/beta-like domain-containing protein n=1 Tax=Soboliphyme baturini TaxID=241478 RepID=A0A183IQU7_9BILA|nr:unnamed protein product [Soboliphyme baturini]
MLAYMPHRDDFEMEYRNDAETVISNVLFFINDDQLDRELKLTLIDMYIRNLIERRRRKRLSRDYNLVYNFFKEEKPQGGSTVYLYPPSAMRLMKREKDLRATLKKFAQFLPCAKFDELVSNIIKERTLKQRIEELQEYSRNGVKSLKGKRKFDLCTPLKRKRRKKEIAMKVEQIIATQIPCLVRGYFCMCKNRPILII